MTPRDGQAPAGIDASSGRDLAPVTAAPLAGLSRVLAAHAAMAARIEKVADWAGLALLMLASGTLLLRPADLFPALAEEPIYAVLIAACLAVSLPRLWTIVQGGWLRRNGVMALLLLLVPAVMLSHLSHANTYDARLGGAEMAKACIYFVLVVAHVDSARKLAVTFLVVIATVFAVTVLAVLQHHGLVNLPAMASVAAHSADADGPGVLMRLCGVGVFNDPNDFALVLVTAGVLCVYGLNEPRAGAGRYLLLFPLALFGYALLLTHSRGGLLSAAGALLAFLPARFGWRNALPLACVLLPVLLALFWGRQTSINLGDPDDTFQARLALWSESLDAFRSAPIFGIGQGRLTDVIGQVTHNSYLHAFAEMGLVGGTAFVGAFYLAIRGLWRAAPADPEVARARPYMLALTVGFAAGLLSLSRCYTVPTQLNLALATSYLVLASRSGPVIVPRLDWWCVRRIACVGVGLLAATYVFVRVMIQR